MEEESHDDNINHRELVGSSNNTSCMMTMMMKGKRRNISSSSSDAADVSSSTSSSGDDLTEEEEDMANCLILLAQGNHYHLSSGPGSYECKTCNRTFHSFQALGGHRASHKKPKTDHHKKLPQSQPSDHHQQQNNNILMLTNKNNCVVNSTGQKIHECSICGAEFTSGQALGGHMRRHRAPAPPSQSPIIAKTNNILALDLNLPAPPEEDGHRTSAFVFSPSPALVDCHN